MHLLNSMEVLMSWFLTSLQQLQYCYKIWSWFLNFSNMLSEQFDHEMLNINRFGGAPLKMWHILLILEIVVYHCNNFH